MFYTQNSIDKTYKKKSFIAFPFYRLICLLFFEILKFKISFPGYRCSERTVMNGAKLNSRTEPYYHTT